MYFRIAFIVILNKFITDIANESIFFKVIFNFNNAMTMSTFPYDKFHDKFPYCNFQALIEMYLSQYLKLLEC